MKGKIPNSREINGVIEKQCNKCGEFKTLDNYYKNIAYYLGTQHECKQCMSLYFKNRNTKDRNRSVTLSKYGLDNESYNAMYQRQGGKCAICEIKLDLLHIDHNHETKVVRGLLCNPCNNALGLFRDDIGILQKAIDYLFGFSIPQ